jgi:hypothetical protein
MLPLHGLGLVALLSVSIPSFALGCGNDVPIKIPEYSGKWKVPGLEQIQKTKPSPTNVVGEFGAEIFTFDRPILLRMGSLEVVTREVARRIIEPEDVIVISSLTALSIRGKHFAYVTYLQTKRFVPLGWNPPVPKPPRTDGLPESAMGGINGCMPVASPTYAKGMGPLMLAYVDSTGDGTFDRVLQTWASIDTPSWVKAIGGESPFEPFSRTGNFSPNDWSKSGLPFKLVDPPLPKLAKP